MNEKTHSFDGAKMAILSNRLEGIARKMGNTLLRTGRSGVLNRAQDFSCCLTTADGELLAAAVSLPVHVLGGIEPIIGLMREYHPGAKRGDAFLHNSPFHGNTHSADHIIVVPIFDEDGNHRLNAVAKAHQADIGNSVPTTYFGTARDVYEEGALLFPCVKIQQDYKDVGDIIRICEMRIRVPEQWYGDYLAMLGAARIGEREIISMAAEIGWDSLQQFSSQWFDYSENRMESAIRQLPEGKTEATSTHDPMPGTPEDGVHVKVKIEVKPKEGKIIVDLRDNIDCIPSGLNLTVATATAEAMIGIYNSIDHTVPRNAGSNRRIQVLLRENCVVGIPKHPTSCSVATTNIADRVANATQCAMSKLGDGIGMAECATIIPPAIGVISGIDPRSGKRYVNQLILGVTGGAGTPHGDGWLTLAHVGNAGMSRQDSVEMAELYQPIQVHRKTMLADSEGAGKHRGSPALLIEYGPVDCDCEIGYVCDGIINAPKGVRGGGAAWPAEAKKRLADGSITNLPAVTQAVINPDENVISISSGAGGYGDPVERVPEKVLHDVLEGYISEKRAKEVYRVVITENMKIDDVATENLRKELH